MTLRAADVLARRLYDAGCRQAFGVPGGEVLTLLDALEKAGITFYLAKHENAAGFMAEGTWHATGAPGILLATVGPGITNGVNAVVNAEQDRVPLIVISGCIDPDDQATYVHQVLDQRKLLSSVCKGSFELSAATAGVVADKAVNIALDGRPGPVHIDVPISAADAAAEAYSFVRAVVEPVAPAAGSKISQARDWLAKAERPLLIAGYDAVLDGSTEQVRSFARQTGIPVLTTYKAKGIVPESDPQVAGCFSLSPVSDRHIQPLVSKADTIVLAGYDPIEVRSGWRDPWNPARQRIIEFSTERNQHYVHHASVSFIGHVGAGLDVLGAGLKIGKVWPDGEPGDVREALSTAYGQGDDWGPAAIVDEVRKATPEEAVVTMDTGAHRIVASQVWPCSEPETLLQSVGLASMGCGVPMAAAVKIARPEAPVLCFTGDGGLMMALGELGTLSDYKLPVVIVVFVDRSLALIEIKQRQRQLTNAGVDFAGDYDYAKIAESFGGTGVVVSSRSELNAAVSDGFSRDRFTLVACEFSRMAYDGRL